MHDGPKEGFAFVIDTDSYAGNFEREMTAYITGEIGECEVGKSNIQDDFDYSMFKHCIIDVPDEHGCRRPTASWPIKEKRNGYDQYDAVAIFFEDMPNEEQIKIMKERAHMYSGNSKIKITGFRVLEFKYTIEEIEV